MLEKEVQNQDAAIPCKFRNWNNPVQWHANESNHLRDWVIFHFRQGNKKNSSKIVGNTWRIVQWKKGVRKLAMNLYMLERCNGLNKSAIFKGEEKHLKENSVTFPGTIWLFSCSATHSRRDTVLKCCYLSCIYPLSSVLILKNKS